MAAVVTGNGAGAHAVPVSDESDVEVAAKARRRRFTASYKLAIVAEYDSLTEPGAKGALLRREGLYSSHVIDWRRARDSGALQALDRQRGRKPAAAGDGEADRQRRRAERAEAELDKARRVIEVQGKVSALLETISESADEDTR